MKPMPLEPCDEDEIERRKREAKRPLSEKYPNLGLWIVFAGLVLFSAMIFAVLTLGK